MGEYVHVSTQTLVTRQAVCERWETDLSGNGLYGEEEEQNDLFTKEILQRCLIQAGLSSGVIS